MSVREPWFPAPGDDVVVTTTGSGYYGMAGRVVEVTRRRRGPRTTDASRRWDAHLWIGGRDVGWFTDSEVEPAESANSQPQADK